MAVIQSGWWTPETAHKAGIADHPFCLNCGPSVLGSAQHRLWACPAYRETRMNLLPTYQHQGQTATGDKLKWERGLMHDPAEKYTPGRTHDGTIHVWIHPSVVGNSFGDKLFVDGSLTLQVQIAGWTSWMGGCANPRDFPRAGLLSARCHADLSPSAAPHPAGRVVCTVAGRHLVGTRSNVRI